VKIIIRICIPYFVWIRDL